MESKEVQALIAQGVKVPTTIKAYNAGHYNILGVSIIVDDNNALDIRTRLITKSLSDWQKMNDYKKSAPRLCNSKQAIILHDPTLKKKAVTTPNEFEPFETNGRLTDTKKEKIQAIEGVKDYSKEEVNALAKKHNADYKAVSKFIASL